MYDKLGELLSETLEAGEIKFVKVERPVNERIQKQGDDLAGNTKTDSINSRPSDSQNSDKCKNDDGDKDFQKSSSAEQYKSSWDYSARKKRKKKKPLANNSYFYKKVTPELERAYRLLDINFQSTFDDVKKAYKEKLKYYHPDRYAGNEVLTKVATDKTRQIVESFNMISEFLTK